MVEGTNTNSARKSGNTKILSVIFCILLVSMVGLIVANVIIHFMGGKGDSGEPEETFACSDYSEITDIAQCVRESYEVTAEKEKIGVANCTGICYEYAQAILSRIEKDQPADKYDHISKMFSAFMLAVNDDKSAAGLTFVRNRELLKLQSSSSHLEELLQDAIKADEMLGTPESADGVIELAYRSGKNDIAMKYLEIKRAREKELGIDSSGGQG